MELKAFKGMPHEFGGIDYTEGSEVEGGEFAVQIGKNGNEYIFDKNSSEGERLSKEYKRLDKNGRLTEDDPLALETFDQIAREEALRHAQRSVNEKGIDPFRNMYEQGGQAANGGVKYATGGPMMNPAEVPNVNPGAQYNTSMSYAPKTAEEYYRQTQGESRMRDSFGTQTMRERETDKAFKEIGKAEEFGMLVGDMFLTPITSAVTGKSFSEMTMESQNYTSSDATKRAVGDDTMTGTAFGYGFAESEGVISNLGSSFFGKEGGAMPKDKYAQGGASGQKDMYMGGGGWMQLFEGIHNVRQTSKQMAGPAIDANTANNMGEEYVRNPIAGLPTTSGQGITIPQKEFDPETSKLPPSPEGTINYGGMSCAPDTMGPFPMDATVSQGGTEVPIWKNGGAKPIYGYYAHGGSHSYTDKIKEAENDLNQSLGNPMNKAFDDFTNELQNNPRLADDDMYLDPYRHGMAGYYTADAMRKKMPSWMPESVANKLAIAGSTIAGVGHEFAAPSTERMGLVDALTEAGQDAYNNYVGASMIEDVLFDREAKQLMLNKIKKEETYPGVVVSDTDPYVKRDNTLKTVPFNTVKLQDGGGKKNIYRPGGVTDPTDPKKKGTVLKVNPENVTADGSQVLEYPNLLSEVVVEDKLDRTNFAAVKNWSRKNDPIAYAARETGSDFINNATGGNFIPSNAKAYMQGILGRKEDFTEDDLTQSEIEVMSKILNAGIGVTDKYVQEQYDTGKPEYDQNTYVSYDDYNRFGASSLYDATPRHLWDPASRWKTLLGSSDVTDRGEYWEVGPNAYDFDDYTNTPFSEMTLLDMAGHMYNKSPFRAKTPMNMHFRIPKQYKK